MIYIYGVSDDLIEIDGDWSEEFNKGETLVATSNGVVAHIQYRGDWEIRLIKLPLGITCNIYPAGSEKAEALSGRDYTDVLVIEQSVDWVVAGEEIRDARN